LSSTLDTKVSKELDSVYTDGKFPNNTEELINTVLYGKYFQTKFGDWRNYPKQSSPLVANGMPIAYTKAYIN